MALDPALELEESSSSSIASQKRSIRGKKKKGKGKSGENTLFDILLRVSLRSTKFVSRPLAGRIPAMRDSYLRSNLSISPEAIIALSVFFSLCTLPFMAFGIYEMYSIGFDLGIIAMPIIPCVPLILGFSIPKISESSRAGALENELPYLIGYITVLAGGGISPLVTIKRISKADRIFPAAAREARRILLDIEVFGMDAITALERVNRFSPNRLYADFIGGYVAVLKTGGNTVSYLETKLREIFNYREGKVRASSDFIGMMSEAYIIMTVVMGIALMILFATTNLMSPGITTVDPSMIIMFSGVAVPFISMLFIVVIGAAQLKEPFGYDRPYYVFLGSLPIAALFYFLPLGIPVYYSLGIGLALATAPGMIVNQRYTSNKRNVEAKLSNFLRDISEIRKTGLAPEKTIEQLSDRNYGGLSVHVKQISTQLSWGVPIRTVLENFSSTVKSWLVQAMAFLLLEVVDVGGGSSKMFVSLADFTEKNAQLEKEKRSLVRPFIIIPYIGAIMVVATTAMMIFFVSAPELSFPGSEGASAYLPSQSVISSATTILLTASFFQAWIMGFVAGKMGESTVADGFKHAFALIVISMITVVVSGLFIKF